MDTEIAKFGANVAAASVVVAFVAKKVGKKELLPISGWKQAITTYATIFVSGYLSNWATKELERRNMPAPKPK